MMMTTASKADRTEPRGRSDCLTLMHTSPISIGIFIDGGYFSKINDELRRRRQLQIDIHGYLEYIRGRIAQHAGTDPSDCLITESHYFRGRFRAATANEKHILLPERYFEDALIDNDVIFHYKHLREVPNSSGGTTIVEKGVDVWFALEAYELTSIRRSKREARGTSTWNMRRRPTRPFSTRCAAGWRNGATIPPTDRRHHSFRPLTLAGGRPASSSAFIKSI